MRSFVKAAFAGLAMAVAAQVATAQDRPGLQEMLRGLLPGGAQESQPRAQAPNEPARRVPFGREDMQLSFAPLVADTAPGVVNVYASQQARTVSPFSGDPFFERFFNRQMPPRVQSSLGSGVLVDASGLIVTNNHVIANADEVKVALADGREFESTILLKDESLDLAVLKIDADGELPAVPIGDSDALEVGDLVLAIGNPFGVGQTTTSGIVSALARTHIGVTDFGFFIQTDAAINPGNSGGALINMAGELIGINTAIYSRTGGSIGIGFAIPSNMVSAVVEAAREGRDFFERPYIGAGFDAVTSQVAEALGMARPAGALVSSVEDGAPASRAGVRPGDVVLAINGARVEHPDALGYRRATQRVGAPVRLTLLRQGREVEVEVTLVRAPEGGGSELMIDGESPFAGATVAELSPRLAQRLRLPADKKGVAVVNVARNSPAAGVGLRPRDIIRELNGTEIASAQSLQSASRERTRWWRFSIERDGRLMRQVLRY
jgi:Do/DeqQ family serine protease